MLLHGMRVPDRGQGCSSSCCNLTERLCVWQVGCHLSSTHCDNMTQRREMCGRLSCEKINVETYRDGVRSHWSTL